MKRLAFLALLLSASCVVAAPAPFSKPQRPRADRPVPPEVVVISLEEDLRIVVAAVPLFNPPPQAPAQPPNADPPG